MPAAADIRKQADARFRHGEARVLGRDAVFAGQGDANPAAHGDAIHESHDRLVIGHHLMVELVFVVEELAPALAPIVQRGMPQQVDIPARAEAAPFRMVEDHGLDLVVIRPF